jgi:hypothetical protein
VGSLTVRGAGLGKPRSVSVFDGRRTLCVTFYVVGLFGRRGSGSVTGRSFLLRCRVRGVSDPLLRINEVLTKREFS